jgi:hypothetical protein
MKHRDSSLRLAFDLLRVFPKRRFKKIPKTVSRIQSGKLHPIWAVDKNGRRFGVLLLQPKLKANERMVQEVLGKVPELKGKKLAGASYIAVKATPGEKGKIHMVSLFERARKLLLKNNYDAMVIKADAKA